MQFTTATTLVAGLAKAHGERRLDAKLLALAKPKLLIVDELGYLPLEPDAALPTGQPPIRNRRDADQVEPQRCRMGHCVRRSRGRHRDPRPAFAPQPRADDPRRQLPAPRQAQERPHPAAARW
ncbi:bll1938 [Bradyrhizobium diazoefficiens USDA 110]|uniref:Bll1938 protein n=1 Tax=Bradyrhizobium diazoefficiens (strain JCM 10833 / BCRC 13528 / IAM 13628 / NBRC 14792 / USDA 110) TaxID=224911 RepID=Q89TJ9_BRADU|nr:hypothetical protein Bdiaspc4_09845 [Bradyrhizobium diazoefficiens]BAC47203.1 bll1938 [Bradyrhizobium diazoefficiens USDA 110]